MVKNKIFITIPIIIILTLFTGIVKADYITNQAPIPTKDSFLQSIFSPQTGQWYVYHNKVCANNQFDCVQTFSVDSVDCYCPIRTSSSMSVLSLMTVTYPINLNTQCDIYATGTTQSEVEDWGKAQSNTQCAYYQSTDKTCPYGEGSCLPNEYVYGYAACCKRTAPDPCGTCGQSQNTASAGCGVNGCEPYRNAITYPSCPTTCRLYSTTTCVTTSACQANPGSGSGGGSGGSGGNTPQELKCCYWNVPTQTLQDVEDTYSKTSDYVGFVNSISTAACKMLKLFPLTSKYTNRDCNNPKFTPVEKIDIKLTTRYSYALNCPSPNFLERPVTECETQGLQKYIGSSNLTVTTVSDEEGGGGESGTTNDFKIASSFAEWKDFSDVERFHYMCWETSNCQKVEGLTITCSATSEIRKEVAITVSRNANFVTKLRDVAVSLLASSEQEVAQSRAPQGLCLAKEEATTADYCQYLTWAPSDFPTKTQCTNGVLFSGLILVLAIALLPRLLGGK